MKTIEQIAALMNPEAAAELQAAIGEIRLQINGSHSAYVTQTRSALAAKDAQLAAQGAEAAEAIQAWREAVAAKDAELAAQADSHAIALANLTDQHADELAAAVEAAKLAIQANLDALVQAAEAAHASGDLDTIGAVLAQARSYTTAARRAKIEAEIAAAAQAKADAEAKLAAL